VTRHCCGPSTVDATELRSLQAEVNVSFLRPAEHGSCGVLSAVLCYAVLCCGMLFVWLNPAGTSDLIADRMTLTPPKIESYFGISRGASSAGIDKCLGCLASVKPLSIWTGAVKV
jgi:hypothetical protein